MNWFTQSLIAMICLVPGWLVIPFFERNFSVPAEVFVVWYFIGVSSAAALFGGYPLSALTPNWWVPLAVFAVGITIGGTANIMIFRACAHAPNPGMAVAIANAASIGVCVVAALGSHYLPRYFAEAHVDAVSVLGIVLTVVGVILIASRR